MRTKANSSRLRTVRVCLTLEALERRELFACGLPAKVVEWNIVEGMTPWRMARRSDWKFILIGNRTPQTTTEAWMYTLDSNLNPVSAVLLPSLGGGSYTSTFAWDVSENGEWITGWSHSPGPTEQAYLISTWTPYLTTALPGAPPYYGSHGRAVADDGLVAGTATLSVTDSGAAEVPLGGQWTALPESGHAGVSSLPMATSRDGTIKHGNVDAYYGSHNLASAVRWNADGMTVLPDLGQGAAIASASPNGHFAGGLVNALGYGQAAYWDNSQVHPLWFGQNTMVWGDVRGVTNAGMMVGIYLGQYYWHGFIFDVGWPFAKDLRQWFASQHGVTFPQEMLNIWVSDVYQHEPCNLYFVAGGFIPFSNFAYIVRVPNHVVAQPIGATPFTPIPSPKLPLHGASFRWKHTFVNQFLPARDSLIAINPQGCDRGSADQRSADQNWSSPTKMRSPFVPSQVVKHGEFLGLGINTGEVSSFETVASKAS